MKIAVFDSGLGGILVLKELIKNHPNHEYIFYGDSANIPYGNKSHDFLMSTQEKIINFFIEEQVDLIIVACGTMSSVIDKSMYPVKIIDVISVTSDYINETSYKNIGLIATLRTVEEGLFQKNLEKGNKIVTQQACPDLVNYIENNLTNTPEFNNYLKKCLSVFIDQKIDALILGCTHYPFVKNEIKKYLGVKLIDMGSVLSQKINLSKEKEFKLTIYFSERSDLIVKNVQRILGIDCDIIEKKI